MDRYKILLAFVLSWHPFLMGLSQNNFRHRDRAQDSAVWNNIEYWFQENRDSFGVHVQKGLVYYELTGNHEKYLDCLLGLANWHYQECKYDLFIHNTRECKQKALYYFGEQSEAYSNCLNAEAVYLRTIGDFDRAIAVLEKVIQLNSSLGTMDLAATLLLIGKIHHQQGDYEGALMYFNKVSQLDLSTFPMEEKGLLLTSNLLTNGQVYIAQGNLVKAFLVFNKAVNLIHKMPSAKEGFAARYLIELNNGLSEVSLMKKDYKQAIQYASKALSFSHSGQEDLFANSYILIGRAWMEQKKWEKALVFFNNALQQGTAISTNPHLTKNLSNYHYWLGLTYQQMDLPDQAIAHFQKGLCYAAAQPYNTNPLHIPALDNSYKNIRLLDLMYGKARALLQLSEEEDNALPQLEAALRTCWQAHDFVRVLYQQYQAEGSKFSLYEKVLPIYELGIDIASQLFEITADPDYLKQAWQMAEYNKAAVLLESVNENLNLGFGIVPDSLLKQERSLKLQISHYEKIISESAGQESKTAEWSDQLFSLQRKFQQLVNEMKARYPHYYQYKFNISPPELNDFQNFLSDKSAALLEFFVGQKKVYLFVLDKDQIRLIDIDKGDFPLDQIQQLRLLLSAKPDAQHFVQDANRFHQVAHKLYLTLVEKPLGHSVESVERLIVVPDGLVNYVPFEVLLKEKPTTAGVSYSVDKLSYLFEEVLVSYAYSASHLMKSVDQPNDKKYRYAFTGFAPSFNSQHYADSRDCSSSEDPGQLYCNAEEVAAICKLTQGSGHFGKEATMANFLETAPHSRMLHLATHACVHVENPKLNKIYFSDGYLTHFDLLHLKMNAELVVLSACNTGYGKLQGGEGLMSLSRSFHMSGCRSSLMSLWKVDDCLSSKMMVLFYEYLSKGFDKDQALQKAQHTYLREVDAESSHPYYWAPFVLFGNAAPIQMPAERSIFFLLGVTALACAVLFISFKTYSYVQN